MEAQVVRLSKKESHYGIGEHTVQDGMVSNFQHQIAYNCIPHIDVLKKTRIQKKK